MKILNAIVGYLAVTSLPFQCFHPFAFASPLAAIDYDGYVDITQNPVDGALMKQFLGNIVETCQTVTSHSGYVNTTQNHSDSALMKRVPGDIIEARWAELAPAALVVIGIVVAVTLLIVWAEDDDPVRGNNAEFLVEHFD